MKKRDIYSLFLIILMSFVNAAGYTVCPDNDNSCDYTQSQFEALSGTGYAGDIFYFKNTATFSQLDIYISGTSDSNRVILDGLQSGDYDAYSEATGNVARIRNTGSGATLRTNGRDYLTIQDFEIDGDDDAVIASTFINEPREGSSYLTFKRIFAHDGLDGFQVNSGEYITFGGAPGDGNVVKDVGTGTGHEDISFGHVSDGIISYNHLYATRDYTNADARGIDGIIQLWSDHILIEYNEIHSHNDGYGGDAYGCGGGCEGLGEDGIDIKENNEYIIVRFNHIYDHKYQDSIIIHSGHKDATGYQHHFYVYGNYMHDNNNFLIWARGDTSGNYNDDQHDVYVWSNIIEDHFGGLALSERDLNADLYNVYIYNNVLEGNAVDAQYSSHAGLKVSNCLRDVYIKNNILFNNNAAYDKRQYWIDDDDTSCISSMTHNDFFHPSDGADTPGYFGTSGAITVSELNSKSIAYNNIAVDPGFSDPANHDFTLKSNSPMRNAGIRITDPVGSVTIQGKTYDLSFSTALHPSTDWDDVLHGKVYTTERPTSGSWDMGAYADSGSVESYCGDGICDIDEDCGSCSTDCGACGPNCGDGTCNNGEDCNSCNTDCGACEPYCGDGVCSNGEGCDICTSDCGVCQSGDFLPGMPVESEDSVIVSPIQTGSDSLASGGAFISTPTSNQGSASFTFDITEPGEYLIEARIIAHDIASDSYYIGLDGENAQGVDAYIWDTIETDIWTWVNVSRRGAGTPESNEFDPMIWSLSSGIHTFTFYGREGNTKLDKIVLRSIGTPLCGPADTPPQDNKVDINELIGYIGRWISGDVAISELMVAIGEWKDGC